MYYLFRRERAVICFPYPRDSLICVDQDVAVVNIGRETEGLYFSDLQNILLSLFSYHQRQNSNSWQLPLLFSNSFTQIKGFSSVWVTPNYVGYLRGALVELPLVLIGLWIVLKLKED